jgi:hypothetical protein
LDGSAKGLAGSLVTDGRANASKYVERSDISSSPGEERVGRGKKTLFSARNAPLFIEQKRDSRRGTKRENQGLIRKIIYRREGVKVAHRKPVLDAFALSLMVACLDIEKAIRRLCIP